MQTDLGPVVQSIVSLTKSLVGNLLSLKVLTKLIVVTFFAEKLCTAKAPVFWGGGGGGGGGGGEGRKGAKNDKVFTCTGNTFEYLMPR